MDTADSLAPVRLDPFGRDQHTENARLREAGPAVLVELPGGVVVWAITHHDTLQELLADPRVGKNAQLWTTFREGRLPKGWPLLNFVTVPGMVTADGADHRRLRGLVTQAFTPRRIAELAPAIEARAERLLDGTGWLPEPLRRAETVPASSEPDAAAEPLPEFLVDDEDDADEPGEDEQLHAAAA